MPLEDVFQLRSVQAGLLKELFDARLILRPSHAGGNGHDVFRQGFWIVIYPEGTRIRAGTRAKYKTGGARLGIEVEKRILPDVHNAGYIWPKGLFGKPPGTVTISFGKPISPLGKDVPTLMREVETWIEGEVARLGVPGRP